MGRGSPTKMVRGAQYGSGCSRRDVDEYSLPVDRKFVRQAASAYNCPRNALSRIDGGNASSSAASCLVWNCGSSFAR